MDDLEKSQEENRVFETVFGPFPGIDSPLDDATINHLYRRIWTRKGLSIPERSMITIAVLAAQGRDRELARHLEGALNIGISRDRIDEILLHLAHYAGWPAAHNAQCIARELYGSEATPRQRSQLEGSGIRIPEPLSRGQAADLIARLRRETGV